jgi:hypothetical protein
MAKAKKKVSSKVAKQSAAGEAKKGAEKRRQADRAYIADAKDNKRGNRGPSGQGEHRARERRNLQAKASERSDASSIGGGG